MIKTSLRSIVKDKLLSTVLILGLVAGLTAVTLVAVYLNFKFSFDNYHVDADRIYRVLQVDRERIWEVMPQKFTDILTGIPGVNSSTKLVGTEIFGDSIKLLENNRKFKMEKAFYADSGFFKVFTHKFLTGNTDRLLANPFEAVITKSFASKIWGNADVVGKTFTFEGKDYNVKAVIEDVPNNSHFIFDVLLSFPSQQAEFDRFANEFYVYFRINNNADVNTVLQNTNRVCLQEYSRWNEKKGYNKAGIMIQPLLDIHLNSESFLGAIAPHGSKSLIKILSLIGLCTLVIIVLNFVNLLIVKYQKRLKEIVIRKMLGADKRNLIFQLLGESVFISVTAALVSLIAVAVLIKPFGAFFDVNLSDYTANFYKVVVFLISLGITIGIIASLMPIYKIIKEGNQQDVYINAVSLKRKKIMYSAVLVQFAIVSGMLATLLVTSNQINYMKNKNLGFNKDNILYFNYYGGENYTAIVTELEKIEGVKKAAASDGTPGNRHSGMTLNRLGAPQADQIDIKEDRIQKGYLAVYGLNLIAGRDFNGTNEDEKDNIILNETAAKRLGYTPASIINTQVMHMHGVKTVIGVVKDYNFMSLHSPIEPLILSNESPRAGTYSVLVNTGDYASLIGNIKSRIQAINPNSKVEIVFMNEHMNSFYRTDEKEGRIIFYVTIMCIILALTGLFALTSYTIIQRTKEIGIRKVLGASVPNILFILYKDFIILITIATLAIVPVTWYLVSGWLDNYAFHINVNMSFYAQAFMIVLSITILTILYHTVQAAKKNPVDIIKYE
jgi:putative ABC transport system permease protein